MSTETPGDDAAPEKHEVTITVSGVPGTGRVAMAQKIAGVLKAYGFEVPAVAYEDETVKIGLEDVEDVLRQAPERVRVKVRLEAVLRGGMKLPDC